MHRMEAVFHKGPERVPHTLLLALPPQGPELVPNTHSQHVPRVPQQASSDAPSCTAILH